MTTKVNFKINPETLNLDVSIEKDISSNDGEISLAKRILSMSTQLNFIDFPYSRSIDLGASIVIEQEFYDEEEFYNEDEYFERDTDNDEENEENEENEETEEDCNESLTWRDTGDDLDSYVITLDHKDAKKIVGGLTTPSCVATILIYEMLKRTINKVELCL